MFVAMNRFKIVRGKEDIFEKIWKERDSKLSEVKGFINFNLIKGKEEKNATDYLLAFFGLVILIKFKASSKLK